MKIDTKRIASFFVKLLPDSLAVMLGLKPTRNADRHYRD